jgi:hypothetical protein
MRERHATASDLYHSSEGRFVSIPQMASVFLFRMAELKAGPNSRLRREHPRAEGAFVDCAVAAQSASEAEALFREALADDEYTLVRFAEVVELGKADAWRFSDMPGEYLEMAKNALDSAEPVYGPFRCWSAHITAAPHSVQTSLAPTGYAHFGHRPA